MDQEKIEELLIELKTSIAAVDAKMQGFLNRLDNHERRIVRLEDGGNGGRSVMDNELVKFLLKGLIIALGVIATTTGSTTLITKLIQQ